MLPFMRVKKDFFVENVGPKRLNEENHEIIPPEFAVLDKDGKQINSWMKCKDFINDTVAAHYLERSFSIYGWKASEDANLSDRWLILAIRWMNKDFKIEDVLSNVKSSVEKLEARLHIPKYKRSRFSKVMHNARNPYFIIFGSRLWMKSPQALSMFTWFIRSSVMDSSGDPLTLKPVMLKDKYYLNSGKEFIHALLKHGLNKLKNTWDTLADAEVENIHSNGFVTWSTSVRYMNNAKDAEVFISNYFDS